MQQLLSEVSVTAPDVGLPDSGDRRKEMVLPRLSNGILILSWIEETCVHVVVETAAPPCCMLLLTVVPLG
jgi:hypothetical protein